ncbi:phosphatidylinositol 3-kinase [Atractiella rhizophila]|nr:phosphatidylinositol 3-kinase [Atractiella rhizophila]
MDAISSTGTLTLARSSQIDRPVSLKLASLQGLPPFPLSGQILCKIQVFTSNKPLLYPAQSTSFKFFKNSLASEDSTTDHVLYTWNEHFTLPIKYRDLNATSQIALTLYDVPPAPEPSSSRAMSPDPVLIGGTTVPLFSSRKLTLKKGRQRCYVHKGVKADGGENTSTPAKVDLANKEGHADKDGIRGRQYMKDLKGGDEMGRLEKLVKKHGRGDLIAVEWLDKLAFREIEKVHSATSLSSSHLFLYVEHPLPSSSFPIVFSPSVPFSSLTPSQTLHQPSYTSSHLPSYDLLDPSSNLENPVEQKHRIMLRRGIGGRLGVLDRELKPSPTTRDELIRILSLPPTEKLGPEALELLWTYRFYLSATYAHALPKFLRSVSWEDPMEVQQAVEVLLANWIGGGGGVEEALEVLGPGVGEAGRERRVREWATRRLGLADDEELVLYLLQLVQALKFEPPPLPTQAIATSSPSNSRYSRSFRSNSIFLPPPSTLLQPQSIHSSLEAFLIHRSSSNLLLASQLYWCLTVESSDPTSGALFRRVRDTFLKSIDETIRGELQNQIWLVDKLSGMARDVRTSKETRPKKIEKLMKDLNDPKNGMASFKEGIFLPLDPAVEVVGTQAEKSGIFKSNLLPLRICLTVQGKEDDFESSSLHSSGSLHKDKSAIPQPPETYSIIFKSGDDLRQDQLVIQLFTLMDRLLKKENLDLKLMPYKVLATSEKEGMVQFVESRSIGEISSEYGSSGGLLGWFREVRPDKDSIGTYGVDKEVLETFVRSCAGYCVVTYLLGVGDRHLDNLLVSPDGYFFHVDFGYIFGRDPKPFPPPLKLSREMVEAMGGQSSTHFQKFKHLSYTAFIGLRKNANLILNLVSMMVDANIPDIRLEPDKAVSKMQDKFRLDLGEEEAIKYFETLLNENSYLTLVFDRIHQTAQYFRT